VVDATPRPLYFRERDPVLIVLKAGWKRGPVWTGAENLDPTGIFFIILFSVCTLSVSLSGLYCILPFVFTQSIQHPAGFEPAIPASERPQT
jgi:hypothetical protein